MTNIARHADARTAELTLVRQGGDVMLRVRDDGRGIPADAITSATGIRGMRERAMLVGARLTIAALPEGGTEVVLRIPTEPTT